MTQSTQGMTLLRRHDQKTGAFEEAVRPVAKDLLATIDFENVGGSQSSTGWGPPLPSRRRRSIEAIRMSPSSLAVSSRLLSAANAIAETAPL
jgi:hypothetical protein